MMEAIDDIVMRHRGGPSTQPVKWSRSNWAEVREQGRALPGVEVLDLFDAEFDGEGAGTLRRAWVRALADGDPTVFLAATTIWGSVHAPAVT